MKMDTSILVLIHHAAEILKIQYSKISSTALGDTPIPFTSG